MRLQIPIVVPVHKPVVITEVHVVLNRLLEMLQICIWHVLARDGIYTSQKF